MLTILSNYFIDSIQYLFKEPRHGFKLLLMKSIPIANLKIAYLIVLSTGLFFIQNWWLIFLLFTLQCFLWYFSSIPIKPLVKALIKLKWFFLIIIVAYTFFPTNNSSNPTVVNLYLFSLNVYYPRLLIALIMLSRIALMLMASLWVRKSLSQLEFVQALKAFKVPEIISIVIDLTLSQLSSKGKNKGDKMNKKNKKKHKTKITFKEFTSNKTQFIHQLIEKNIHKSDQLLLENYPDISKTMRKDVLVILSVAVAIMSLKLLQLMPGLPIAPGHKNLLVIPLIILASLSTHMKYGGLAAGFATGIVSFLMGFGKFGIFEVLHFALPGLMADWLNPILKTQQGKWLIFKLAIIGAILGFTRFVANIFILLLVGAPKLALIVMTPMLISQIVFGALSSIVCVVVIKKHNNGGWFQ